MMTNNMKRMAMDIPIYVCFVLQMTVGDNNGNETTNLVPYLDADLHICTYIC
jgi:hypothetical protein